MSYIAEIFERFDLQQIARFLQNGTNCMEVDHRPYQVRLEESGRNVLEAVTKAFPDEDENEAIMDKVYDYANTCENVYMEIGLQAGAVLALQMFQNTSVSYAPKDK